MGTRPHNSPFYITFLFLNHNHVQTLPTQCFKSNMKINKCNLSQIMSFLCSKPMASDPECGPQLLPYSQPHSGFTVVPEHDKANFPRPLHQPVPPLRVFILHMGLAASLTSFKSLLKVTLPRMPSQITLQKIVPLHPALLYFSTQHLTLNDIHLLVVYCIPCTSPNARHIVAAQ